MEIIEFAEHELVESEDHVEINGTIFNKPFVEKPVSAEDHNIYIYYPTSAGGGSQRLFRKIGSRSSVYSPESRVRKTGSFIYEDFMPTDGKAILCFSKQRMEYRTRKLMIELRLQRILCAIFVLFFVLARKERRRKSSGILRNSVQKPWFFFSYRISYNFADKYAQCSLCYTEFSKLLMFLKISFARIGLSNSLSYTFLHLRTVCYD